MLYWTVFLEWFASGSALIAVALTQLANHKHYFASDYYVRQDYLQHYSARMRKLIQKQRAA